MDAATLKFRIRSAFDAVEYPGDDRIAVTDSYGDEPELTAAAFVGKRDRWAISSADLDYASLNACCLSFFTPEAFRFYLPAFMVADLDGSLGEADPEFYLWNGLTDDRIDAVASRVWTGDATCGDLRREHFADFTREQAAVVVEVLRSRVEFNGFNRSEVGQALRNFWLAKAGEPAG